MLKLNHILMFEILMFQILILAPAAKSLVFEAENFNCGS